MKPLLAGKVSSIDELKNYPYFAAPKLDGIRCIVHPEMGPVSRNFKPIQNFHVRSTLDSKQYKGLDGELVVGSPTGPNVFTNTSSGIMARGGRPEFKFLIFDDFTHPERPFIDRLDSIANRFAANTTIEVVEHKFIRSKLELLAYEEECILLGYEGIMLRSLNGIYKYGRSTAKEEILLKIKRFEDTEGTIVGMIERMQNDNEATINALGYMERSHKKAGMVGTQMMGALVIKSPLFTETFEIGTGFSDYQREKYWYEKERLIGKQITFKYQPYGVKNKPRFPVFRGFRDDIK